MKHHIEKCCISELGWTDEEAALIEEFEQILSTTPRDRLMDTTRYLMMRSGDTKEEEENEETFLQPTEIVETGRSLLSSTSRAGAEEQNSISLTSVRPSTFADLLPRKSLNPPKLEQATTFEDLLSPPLIYEETGTGTRRTINLEKKRKMIKEALERIKKKKVVLNTKIKFPPVRPVRPGEGEDKFQEYEDPTTWGPVTELEQDSEDSSTWGPVKGEEEYEYEEGEEMIKHMLEDHTENSFGLGILSVPNMMETTLLQLLNKSQKDHTDGQTVEVFTNNISSGGGDEKTSELQIANSRDPLLLNNNLREFPHIENIELTVPRKQNPLLSLLDPRKPDYSDDIFSVPEYRQDPLLRLLTKNPKRYQEDFLQLPPKQQNQLLKILMKAGPALDLSQLVPPDYKQNPLLRLLVSPHFQGEETDGLTPPRISQKTIMQALMKEPGKFANDFLILSDDDKEDILDMVDQFNDGSFNIDLLIPSRSERLRILQSHSVDTEEQVRELPVSTPKRSNPLLEFLEGDAGDEKERDQLTVPVYKQDPLLRQLRVRPESYRKDFLELPSRKQDTLLKALKKSGVPRWNIDRLTPPGFEPNPLMRMIKNKDNKFVSQEDAVLVDLMRNPKEFTEDFTNLSVDEKEEVVEMIQSHDDGSFEMEKLIPNKNERLEMMTKNPLLRFLEGNKQDDQDKVNLVPPKYRQDPLLRQLRLRPEMYQSDFLELPRKKQDTLLKLLKSSGLETTLMERLLPPGTRQDPLLRALIGVKDKTIPDLKPPSYKQNPLVKLLRPDKKDRFDRDRLTLPEKEATFQQLVTEPQSFSSEFSQLTEEDQERVVEMLEKSGKDAEMILNKLPPRKSEKLTIVKDPFIIKNIPDYTQSDAFRDISGAQPPPRLSSLNEKDETEKDLLGPPSPDPLLEEVMRNPEQYKNAFENLPSTDKETLMSILREETGSTVDEDFFEVETLKRKPDFSSDVEG